jgi:hypothetical protein
MISAPPCSCSTSVAKLLDRSLIANIDPMCGCGSVVRADHACRIQQPMLINISESHARSVLGEVDGQRPP